MIRILIAGAAGLIFGAGLTLSRMIDPAVVLAFFDVLGAWDPTLAFVMGGAIPVMATAWALAARRETALTGGPLPGPASTRIDARLLGGAALFGLGWGITGLCPAPAVAAIPIASGAILAFVAALAATLFALDRFGSRL